jgi:large subunit ribosomal protein L24
MAVAHKKETRYTKSPISKKVKPGGRRVVSEALVKQGVSNLVPKVHVKRGDMVMLISGPKKDAKYEPELKKRLDERNAYKGQIGKVKSVSPATGKVIIEGVNMVTRAQKQRGMTQAGLVRKEAPIFASRVMLYDSVAKKPTRVGHKTLENGKKVRISKRSGEVLDS